MKIFVPVTRFSNGGVVHGIETLTAEDCRIVGGYILHRGTFYSDRAYIDPQGVWLHWNKEDWKADAFKYEF